MFDSLLSRIRRSKVPEASQDWASALLEFSKMNLFEVFFKLETSEKGLITSEAKERLEEYGPNEISSELPPTWYELLIRSYINPFNILVSALGIIYYFLGDQEGTIIIVSMVLLSVGIRYVQELRSNIAAEKLKAMVSTKATVIRRGDRYSPPFKMEIPMENLVPGDIIFLSAGDMLPADVRLMTSKELFISQSALTGETLPVEKFEISDSQIHTPTTNILEMPNLCFMGTSVLNGTATAAIVNTGNDTYFGCMAKKLLGHRPLTSFDIGINKISWLLIRIMFAMVPIIFLINGFTKRDWFESLLFALSVAVGLIPEMLPMIVTTNLAKGAVKMARSKVIVKKLNSIQNFGAMNILCTDKTGTLTQDRIILEKHLDLNGQEDDAVLKYAYLNSHYQTGLKNLLDVAVLEHTETKTQLQLDKAFRKVDEIPFDFIRRRMSVVVELSPQKHLLICKGAVEEMVEACSLAKWNGELTPLTDDLKKQIFQFRDELNDDGLRVLSVAYKEIPIEEKKEYTSADEHSLILMGFLAFLDPPKQTSEAAIAALQALNVQVKILTGDNEIVTKRICKWVGLKVEKTLNGSQISAMNDEQLSAVIDETTIFSKLSPTQKSRIIALLKAKGHTVGYLGDGINDAPSLREADVGISVDTAVDIAKESADIIMLEKSLLFLKEGVIEGRHTFGNIIKYIKMAISSNFGNSFTLLGASLLLPFLPIMPLQLLVQNLLYDISQITIPFDKVDSDFLKKPRKWDPGKMATFMVYVGPISSIFDYVTFAILWFVFAANSIEKQALFQTGFFVEGLLSQTLIVHMIRTQKIPFIQSIASLPLLLTTMAVMAIGIYLPYTAIGASMGLVPLPGNFYHWLLVILICYCASIQLVKTWFIKKFNYWL